MDQEARLVYDSFKGKLVGDWHMKRMVCKTVAQMPAKIRKFVTSKVWFLSSMEDAWAFSFTGNDLKDQHLIFLSDELLAEDKEQIMHSIAHEIGHVMLSHRNSTLIRQTKEEIEKQEVEAEEFAEKYADLI